MALVTVTGNLTDIAGGDLAGFAPILKLTANQSAVAPEGTIITTRPVTVTPDSNGDFTIELLETAPFRPEVWYTLAIDLLHGGFTWPDFPKWKIRVPSAGGPISSMIEFPASASPNALVWVGDAPPAEGSGFTYWINTSVVPPTFNIGS